MKNKKVIITVAVLIFSVVAYFGITSLQKDLNRKVVDKSSQVSKSEEEKVKEETKVEEDKAKETEKNAEKQPEAKKEEQTKEAAQNKEAPKENSSTVQKQSTQTNNINSQQSKPVRKESEKKSNNFSVIDSVTGKSIAGGYLAIQEGESVESATERFLRDNGVSFKNKDGYMSRIGTLKERDNGANSGWCYYVNGAKVGVGMRNLTLKSSDKIEWKYLADGVNN